MIFFYEQGYDMFDILVFSCKEGVRKPEKKIFELTLKKLGVHAPEAVFIDDKKENVKSAEKIGLKTVLFKNILQLKKELVSLSINIE